MADVRIQQYPLKPVLDDNDYFLIADAEDVDVNGWLKYKKVKAEDLPTIVKTAEDITIAQIQAKIVASDLTLSKFYRITNSASGVSPLLVQAISVNSVSYQAFDAANPLTTINYNVLTDTIRWSLNQTTPPTTLTGTGIVKSTSGVVSYLTDNSANWDTAFNDSIVSAAVTGTTTKTLTLNQQDGGTITASWSDADTGITSLNGLTTTTQTFSVGSAGTDFAISSAGSIHTFNIPTASAINRGLLSSADWTTFNNKASIADLANYLPLTLSADTIENIGANKLFFNGTTPQMFNVQRTTTTGSGGRTALSLIAKTTDNNIQDGYGALLGFDIKDDAGVNSTMAAIVGSRINNNTSGQLDFYTWNNGSFARGMLLTSTGNLEITGSVTANSIIKSGGTSSQYLMADGSTSTLTNIITGTLSNGYVPRATGINTITNSHIQDTGSIIKINDNATDNGLLINITTNTAYLTNTGSNNGFKANGSIIGTVNGGLDRGLKLDFANNYFILENNNSGQGIFSSVFQTSVGDWNDSYNGTKLFIDDANQIIKTNTGIDRGLKLDFANNEAYFNNNNNIGLFSLGWGLYLGDWGGYQNATTLQILDDTRVIKTNDGGSDKGLKLDFATNVYSFGDYNNTNVGIALIVDDNNAIIRTLNGGGNQGLYLDFANNNYSLGAASNGSTAGLYLNNNGQSDIGDYLSNNNATFFRIDDANQVISAYFNGTQSGLYLDITSNHYSLGDNLNNFTTVDVFDATKIIRLNSQRVQYIGQTNATISAFTGNTAGQLVFNSDSNSFQFYNGSAWVGFGGTVTGTGTTNYMTKWSSTSGVTASTLIYDGGTYIGINRTTSAGYLFDINGTFRVANSTYLATTSGGSVGIGLVTVDSSAQLHMSSTTKGALLPRLTTTQINAIGTPANGLLCYNTTLNVMCCYQNGTWVKFSHSPM